MLRKMLKYDLKAMAKTFIPFYAVILLMSVLNIIFIRAEWTPGMVSGTLIYVCLFMALAVVAVVLTITQFYNTVLGPEGYLTNTLPVSVDTIILSKLFSASIWLILSCIVGVLSILILGFGGFASIGEFFSAFGELFGAIGQLLITPSYYADLAQIVAALVLMFVMLLFALFNELLHMYLAMACSQLYPFSKNRIAGSFIAYFLISIPLSILTAALFSATGFVGERLEIIQSLMTGPHTFAAMMLAFAAVIVVLALLNAALYFPTRYILKNKLNLE